MSTITPEQPTAVVKLDLSTGSLNTVLVEGEPHIVFRPAVEAIGLDYSTQLRKLKSRSWANRRDIPTVAEDGKTRQMAAVDVKTFLMWLATVNESKVADAVCPTLVAYQAETTDAVRDYWTQGGAVNPRADDEQLAALIGRAESQMRVLKLAEGLVDAAWLEAKTRHTVARALGEEPEVPLDARPLTVGEYLADRGMTGGALRSLSSKFGRRLKAAYRDEFAAEPPTVERFVDGALRSVAGYTEAHRPLFDAAWRDLTKTP